MKRLAFLWLFALAANGCASVGVFDERTGGEDSAALRNCAAFDGSAPRTLECTGLYSDFTAKRMAGDVRAFQPGAQLWSDGAEKRRFISLPNGGVIDASNVDEWVFPVGTKTWKEFSAGGRLIETRYFEKVRDDKWVRATYIWSADGTQAKREDNGATVEADGKSFAIPDTNQCDKCHQGRTDRVLGFEAVGLASPLAQGVTLQKLNEEKRIDPPIAPESVQIPEDATGRARAALAWLHANCGTACHSRGIQADATATDLWLRLDARQLAWGRVSALDPFATSVGATVKTPKWSGQTRLDPGHPEGSLIVHLAESRDGDQMPPIGTKIADEEGLRAVREWIGAMKSLPRAALDGVAHQSSAP
jgi:hypothetical protein